MRLLNGFIIREVAGDTVVIPYGEAARKLSGLISVNESGKILFDMLQTEQTESSLVEALMENFDIDSATAKADVSEFIDTLRQSGVLVEN